MRKVLANEPNGIGRVANILTICSKDKSRRETQVLDFLYQMHCYPMPYITILKHLTCYKVAITVEINRETEKTVAATDLLCPYPEVEVCLLILSFFLVGKAVGLADGIFVGVKVGTSVGSLVGSEVGRPGDGCPIGWLVGDSEARNVGPLEG